jgi:hypothetical protein
VSVFIDFRKLEIDSVIENLLPVIFWCYKCIYNMPVRALLRANLAKESVIERRIDRSSN